MRPSFQLLSACALLALATTGCKTSAGAESRSASDDRSGLLGEGLASFYGEGFDGRPTASGERFNKEALTAAHRKLRFGTCVRVENKSNGRSVNVRINDRGPYAGQRLIDVSERAARDLGMIQAGVAQVRLFRCDAR